MNKVVVLWNFGDINMEIIYMMSYASFQLADSHLLYLVAVQGPAPELAVSTFFKQ